MKTHAETIKLPAFQFYPGDWRKDPGVQSLDYEARGVWFEILCLMHESTPRGVLTLAGKPMSDEALARLLGLAPDLLKQILTKLETHGVSSRQPSDGALYSRRMVRDEDIRNKRKIAGQKGGNPRLLKQKRTTEDNQNPTPSSSVSTSASSSEVNPPLPPRGAGEGGETEKPTPSAQAKTDTQRRAEKLFRRRETTPWGSAEVKAWKANRGAIEATTDADWAALEAFYAFRETDRHVVYRRRDFATLLNNWTGEVDKARAFQANGPSVRQGAPYIANERQARAEEALMPPVYDLDGNPAEF